MSPAPAASGIACCASIRFSKSGGIPKTPFSAPGLGCDCMPMLKPLIIFKLKLESTRIDQPRSKKRRAAGLCRNPMSYKAKKGLCLGMLHTCHMSIDCLICFWQPCYSCEFIFLRIMDALSYVQPDSMHKCASVCISILHMVIHMYIYIYVYTFNCAYKH